MDDHFDTSGVFEISKFDISRYACIFIITEHRLNLMKCHMSSVMRKYTFCIYVKTKAQIRCTVTMQRISGFVFAT